ncbi:DUF4097 family beta strand repeat-containing protein [Aquihabitans sp. McL0605]|uniref:DUF4097 family beta strand repeat-containing protein n=1 Tax=Aquihabitans sp. McL0605 TaxID=3415671 RepID=UPI003CF0AB3E
MPTFETPRPLTITVDLTVGDVRITAADRPDTVVTVVPADPTRAADVTAAHDIRVEHADGRLTISAPKQWKRFSPFDRSGSVQVTIDVPTGSHLDASTSLGDLHVEGELGRCQLKTAMGDIRLDHAAVLALKTGHGNVDVDRVEGDADIKTGSGDVRLGTIAGAAIVRNSNGATTIAHIGGDVRVKAANGSISIARADGSVVAKTANGSIDVGELRRGVAELETAAGDLSCGVADGTAVNLDVRSRFGRIHSDLDASDGPAPTDEVVELHAHTSAGDITLHRTDGRASAA